MRIGHVAWEPVLRSIRNGVFVTNGALHERIANFTLPSGHLVCIVDWKLGILATIDDPDGISPCLNG